VKTDPDVKEAKRLLSFLRDPDNSEPHEIEESADSLLALVRRLVEFKQSERELSDAYLRIREIVPGAYDTAPGGTDRFEVTETAVQRLVKDLARLRDRCPHGNLVGCGCCWRCK
jgi:hypothetical protein